MAGRVSGFLSRSYRALSARPVSYRPSAVTTSLPALLSPTISARGLAGGVPDLGVDYQHWYIEVKKPDGNPTREEIIDMYVKMLASVVGSEEEAKKKLYSVSTQCYYAFGALLSEELSSMFKEFPNVVLVAPDAYLDIDNKDYGGEPFIDGKPVPYDPKYHATYWRFQNAMRDPEDMTLDDLMDASDSDASDSDAPDTDAPNTGASAKHVMIID